MLETIGIVAAVLVGLFVLFVVFGNVLLWITRYVDRRAAHKMETERLASAVAVAEANKAKADQAVLDALANPLIGDGTKH